MYTPYIYTIILVVFFSLIMCATFLFIISKQKKKMRKMSHDVRTKLSIIKTNSEIALLDDSLSLETKEAFETIIEEIDHASRILTLSSK